MWSGEGLQMGGGVRGSAGLQPPTTSQSRSSNETLFTMGLVQDIVTGATLAHL